MDTQRAVRHAQCRNLEPWDGANIEVVCAANVINLFFERHLREKALHALVNVSRGRLSGQGRAEEKRDDEEREFRRTHAFTFHTRRGVPADKYNLALQQTQSQAFIPSGYTDIGTSVHDPVGPGLTQGRCWHGSRECN